MSQIVKTRLTKTMSNHFKFLFSRLIIHLETTFTSKILFLNHYGQVLFINFRTENVQTPKNYRHFKVRVSEHHGVFPSTGKPVKGT